MQKNNKLLRVILILICLGLIVFFVKNLPEQSSSGKLIKVDYATVKKMMADEESFVLVVSQSTCSHCATYKPKIMQIAEDYKLDMYYIDYDNETKSDQEDFFEEFNFSGATPTTMFIKDGQEVSVLNRLEGDFGIKKVVKQLEKMGFIE